MKTNTIKFLTVLTLLITVSCSVENDLQEEQSQIIENNLKFDNSNEVQQARFAPSYTYHHLEDIPPQTITTNIYIDMANLENLAAAGLYQFEYGCITDFNICYLNVMKNQFTVYSVYRATSSGCEDMERWVINKSEYSAFLNSLINPDGSDTGNTNKEVKDLPPTSTGDPIDETQPDVYTHPCFD